MTNDNVKYDDHSFVYSRVQFLKVELHLFICSLVLLSPPELLFESVMWRLATVSFDSFVYFWLYGINGLFPSRFLFASRKYILPAPVPVYCLLPLFMHLFLLYFVLLNLAYIRYGNGRINEMSMIILLLTRSHSSKLPPTCPRVNPIPDCSYVRLFLSDLGAWGEKLRTHVSDTSLASTGSGPA